MISACMITKNEGSQKYILDDKGKPTEQTAIERCLHWLQLFVGPQGEIVIVDTGSEDDTKERAATFRNVRIFDSHRFTQLTSAGEFHFAEARNEAFCHAAGDWVFWCDADDVMQPADLLAWHDFRQTPDFGTPLSYRFTYVMPDGLEFMRLRLVQRRAGPMFMGAAHEFMAVHPSTQNIRQVVIRHAPIGADTDKQAAWYQEILEKEAERQNRQRPRTLFYLGNQKMALKRYDPAIKDYDDYLRLTEKGGWTEERSRVKINTAQCYRELDRDADALDACAGALREDPRFVETHLIRHTVHMKAEDIEAARAALEDALELRFDPALVLSTNRLQHSGMAETLEKFNEEYPPPEVRHWTGDRPTLGKVSVIIPIHDLELVPRLAECLEGLAEATAHPVEVIVVCNGIKLKPAHKTEIGDAYKVRYVTLSSNKGFAGGNNAGARAATGSVLLFLNADTTPARPFIEPMLIALGGSPGSIMIDPNGMVTPGNTSNKPHIPFAPYSPHPYAGAVGARSNHAAGVAMRTYPGRDEIAQFGELLSGFCFMIRKATFDEIGGWDEAFMPAYWDDNDLAIRVQQAGLDLVACGGAYVHHDEGPLDGQAFQITQQIFNAKWDKPTAQAAHTEHHERRAKLVAAAKAAEAAKRPKRSKRSKRSKRKKGK